MNESLLAAIERHAREHPERKAICFLARGEEPTARLTYAQLQRALDEVAAGLVERDLAGKPVVVALPPGVEFVVCVLASFRAGALVVTIPFPPSAHADRIAAIVADARPAAVLAESDDVAGLPFLAGDVSVPVYTFERLRSSGSLPAEPQPEGPALIQYSSGSTRVPRGVVLTHGNLAANVTMIGKAFGSHLATVTVSWLPPSHDMGLIGTILAPLYHGTTAILMPPAAFIKQPVRWLRAIDRYRAAISGAPNFAYEICERRITREAIGELDLSTWRLAFCGAEPIRIRTLDAFAETFAAAGFRRENFLACYGLAEATLLVSAGPLREAALGGGAGTRVSAGRAADGCSIAIGRERSEIFIAGDHVSPGWWCGERRSVVAWEGTFERDGRRFVPTGDVGAIEGHELFVLDRLKDVIAMYGRKIHAVDVEQAAIDAGGGVVAAAAFAIDGARGERLVALCELSARDVAHVDRAALGARLGLAVADATGFAPVIVLLRHGVLPRTASGKIIRHAARERYLAGTLPLPATTGTT